MTDSSKKQSKNPRDAFVGASLLVVFAETDDINNLREAGSGALPLQPPINLAEEDTYLVIPDDIGMELIDILCDNDEELLRESLADGLVAIGRVSEGETGTVLQTDYVARPIDVLNEGLAHAATVEIPGDEDPVQVMNTLPHAQCTMLSTLVDDDGLDSMLRRRQHIGVTWRPPPEGALETIDPTFAWSLRRDDGRISMEFALFVEEEELIALLRPVLLAPSE